jgi:hypothetical protein
MHTPFNRQSLAVQQIGDAVCHLWEIESLTLSLYRCPDLRSVVQFKFTFRPVVQIAKNMGGVTTGYVQIFLQELEAIPL